MTDKKNRVAVIGAGVGGLAAAARLGHKGFEVDVYEKLPRCGGRANIIEDSGFKFDTGPSFVLMPSFFDEIFTSCGTHLYEYLDFEVLDISYKIFYPDGRELTVFRDSKKTKEELEKFEKGSSKGFDAFIKHTAKVYRNVEPLLYQCFTARALFDPRLWPLIVKLEPFKSYWQLAQRFFKSEELCYAFTFEAMFIGVSPFKAPSFYSVITYADHVQNVSHPMGGMYQIPLALERLGKEKGVRFHYNSEVRRIEEDHGELFVTLDGQRTQYDSVVVNADYAYAESDLFDRLLPDYTYSCSTWLMYLGLKEKIPGLEHHNLFFSNDLRKNLQQIFTDKTVPEDPSFYVHVPTVTDQSLAPEGKDIVYILVPVANLQQNSQNILEHEGRLRRLIFEKIKKVTGKNLEDSIEVEHKFYPHDFILRYNINYGATFGLAHTLFQSAFFRPPNTDDLENVYYVGASTQPGGGLPVVLASSRIVADMIAQKKVKR